MQHYFKIQNNNYQIYELLKPKWTNLMRDGEELAYHDRPILLYFANEAA
jgi:hypothetical protein